MTSKTDEDREADRCPECGGELYSGYGLYGGGCGFWQLCHDCDWFKKTQDEEEREIREALGKGDDDDSEADGGAGG